MSCIFINSVCVGECGFQDLYPSIRLLLTLNKGGSKSGPSRIFRTFSSPLLHKCIHAVNVPVFAANIDLNLRKKNPTPKLWCIEISRIKNLVCTNLGCLNNKLVRLPQCPGVEIEVALVTRAFTAKAGADDVFSALLYTCSFATVSSGVTVCIPYRKNYLPCEWFLCYLL